MKNEIITTSDGKVFRVIRASWLENGDIELILREVIYKEYPLGKVTYIPPKRGEKKND